VLKAPMIDVVIPTVSGREESLARCIDSYRRHSSREPNFIIIEGEPTCGEAWIAGLELATEDYVHLTCDDIEVVDDKWLGSCVSTVRQGCLPCPLVRRPDGSIESCGGDMSFPNCLIPGEQPSGTRVDFTVLPFMSREQVDRIGMIPSHYLSDTWVSYRGRALGYPTFYVAGYEVVHHHESTGRLGPSSKDREIFDRALQDAEAKGLA
jgi:GT2 family glycosyltransferase